MWVRFRACCEGRALELETAGVSQKMKTESDNMRVSGTRKRKVDAVGSERVRDGPA